MTRLSDHQELPPPQTAGRVPLEKALSVRRSIRQFSDKRLTLKQIGQLCWAGQGITDTANQYRTAPSAGALYPLELYVAHADGLDHYEPHKHRLRRVLDVDLRDGLRKAALDQECVGSAPVVLVLSVVRSRCAQRYGTRGEHYCCMEVGHAAQNVLLQAVALGLGGVAVGAFEEDELARLLKLRRGETPAYLIPVGYPAEGPHRPRDADSELP